MKLGTFCHSMAKRGPGVKRTSVLSSSKRVSASIVRVDGVAQATRAISTPSVFWQG
ncbi:hypothetical protein ACFPRL_17230 [Pseudoclavibacter helvolus]